MFKKLLFVALMSAQFGAFAQYCSTSLHSVSCTVSGNGYIDDVSISSTSLNNSGSGCNNATDAYTYFSGLSQYTATLTKGSTYSLNVTEGLQSSDISVWIDYNQNQLFEASEWNQVAIGSSVGVASSVSITIPGSAASGLTRMRIRTRNTGFSNGSGDACTSFGSGETEDYDITIVGGGSGTGCISISQYPANTITGPTSNGQTVVITPSTGTTCNYSGEYGVLSLTAGNYTLTSSNPTDYFTVTTTTSTVLFTGSTPLTFSIAAAGTYQSHIFSSSSCVTDNIAPWCIYHTKWSGNNSTNCNNYSGKCCNNYHSKYRRKRYKCRKCYCYLSWSLLCNCSQSYHLRRNCCERFWYWILCFKFKLFNSWNYLPCSRICY